MAVIKRYVIKIVGYVGQRVYPGNPGLGGVSMTDIWKVHAFALATTTGVAYVLCAIFDLLFPPFGFLAALAPASPWPITGSPIGF